MGGKGERRQTIFSNKFRPLSLSTYNESIWIAQNILLMKHTHIWCALSSNSKFQKDISLKIINIQSLLCAKRLKNVHVKIPFWRDFKVTINYFSTNPRTENLRRERRKMQRKVRTMRRCCFCTSDQHAIQLRTIYATRSSHVHMDRNILPARCAYLALRILRSLHRWYARQFLITSHLWNHCLKVCLFIILHFKS